MNKLLLIPVAMLTLTVAMEASAYGYGTIKPIPSIPNIGERPPVSYTGPNVSPYTNIKVYDRRTRRTSRVKCYTDYFGDVKCTKN